MIDKRSITLLNSKEINLRPSIYDSLGVPVWEEDARELKLKIDELKRSGISNFKQYFDTNPSAIIQFIDALKIINVNEATVELFKAKNKRDIIEGIRLFFVKERFSNFQSMLLKFIEGVDKYSYESIKKTKYGHKFITIVTVTIPPSAQDDWSIWLVTETDVTEQRLREEKLAEECDIAERTVVAKDKLLSIIAHDLKNPFNNILGFSSLLLSKYETLGSDRVKAFIEHINESATSSHNLLANLLNWSRVQQSELQITPENIDLVQIFDINISLLRSGCKKKNILITKQIPQCLAILSDYNMVDFIVRNILSNAVKFSQRNSKIAIIAKQHADYIELSISDKGIGIPRDEVNSIFTMHKQNRRGTENEKGTGFGLILCNEFIGKLNGKISVVSSEGAGSTFNIILPLVLNNMH